MHLDHTSALLIGYRRLDFIKRRLEELSANTQIPIIVSIDGSDWNTERNFRELLDMFISEHPEMNVTYKIQEVNLGLARHIFSAITEVLREFEQVIVIEDDIVLSRNFIRNMLNGLELANQLNNIGAVGGFSMFTNRFSFTLKHKWRKTKYFNAWGWGINRNNWRNYELEIPLNYLDLLNESKVWQRLSAYRRLMWSYRFEKVTNRNPSTWDYQFQYFLFRHDLKTLLTTSRISDNEGFESEISSNTKGNRPRWMGRSQVFHGLLVNRLTTLSYLYQIGDAFTIEGDTRMAKIYAKLLGKTFNILKPGNVKKLIVEYLKKIPGSHLAYRAVHYLRVVAQKFHLTGAREISLSGAEIARLKLNRNYALGAKGTLISLPKDGMIFEYIRLRGEWELDESKFLANELKRVCTQESDGVALVDIGANTGLVTLQVMNLAKTNNICILFEPSNQHASAIRSNLKSSNFEYMVNEFALGSFDGEAELFTQVTNSGNSSLLESVVPLDEKSAQTVRVVNTKRYFEEEISNFKKFIIKCDTQGYDAVILSRIPKSVWDKVEAAVIEVWALPSIQETDVHRLLEVLRIFRLVSWDSQFRECVDLDSVSHFWLSKSLKQRNLFLKK